MSLLTKSLCHGGAKPAFTVGKVTIWGAAGVHVDHVPPPLLAQISFSYDIIEAPLKYNKGGGKLFRKATQFYHSIPELPCLYIDWHDRDEPPVPFKFWHHLVSDLKEQTVESNLILNCMGGHGRTGTALACLAYCANLVPEGEDAIEWLRAAYCKEAVESEVQIDYLKSNGVFTNVVPTYKEFTYGNSYSWEKCTKCAYYATPEEAKNSVATGGAVICGDCSGKKPKKSISEIQNRFCQVCNYSLTHKEEAHSTVIGVDICKPCEDKFGIEGAKESSDIPPMSWW